MSRFTCVSQVPRYKLAPLVPLRTCLGPRGTVAERRSFRTNFRMQIVSTNKKPWIKRPVFLAKPRRHVLTDPYGSFKKYAAVVLYTGPQELRLCNANRPWQRVALANPNPGAVATVQTLCGFFSFYLPTLLGPYPLCHHRQNLCPNALNPKYPLSQLIPRRHG